MRSQRTPSANWGTDTCSCARLRAGRFDAAPFADLRSLAEPTPRRGLEDQAGFEPAMGVSRRVKSPPRSAATVTGPNSILANPGGFDPLADGLKGRSLSVLLRG